MGNKKINLIYLVAGISSRFNGNIKALINTGVKNKTLIEYSLDQALKNNFSKIILIVGDKTKKPFMKKFGNKYKNVPIEYALQSFDTKKRDKPWGTGDALVCAKKFIDGPFVACNGDDIYGEHSFKILYDHLQKSEDDAIAGYKPKNVIPEKSEVNRGIITPKNNFVKEINETHKVSLSNIKTKNIKPKDLCSMNLMALHPKTLEIIEEELNKFKEKNKESRDKEFYLPVIISKLINKNQIKMRVHTTNSKWFGVTNPGDELILKEKLKRK